MTHKKTPPLGGVFSFTFVSRLFPFSGSPAFNIYFFPVPYTLYPIPWPLYLMTFFAEKSCQSRELYASTMIFEAWSKRKYWELMTRS